MAVLVHHFNHEEQVVCHLAAKTVSTNVVYHLHKCGAVSPIWQQKCVEAFNSSVSGPELDSCLWSLTDVLKQLLKEAHQEILQRLLAAFDSSLCTLCSNFLPEQRKEAAQGLVGFTQGRPRGTTFCLFLDLLEALTASTLMCDTGLKSQRLTYLHSSALLTTVSCSPEYFVKKRVLLLLKRAVLQKAGEDWALGDVLSTGLRYQHLSSNSNMLAQTVLTTVADNWLQSLQVESASFFGGTRRLRAGEGQKADCVMLRAVSLLLLKSMDSYLRAMSLLCTLNSTTLCQDIFIKSPFIYYFSICVARYITGLINLKCELN
uniref:Protein Lines N-terminal domain-containing protein n=1 Tax=Echeneis naucrates TaxID=173247 RepID=A0A665T8Y2_ECHNA